MKFPSILSFLIISVISFGSSALLLGQDDSDRGKGIGFRDGKPSRPGAGNSKSWDALEEGQKQKLREALREVWTDPAVISAREEVKVASEAYQRAIRTAISKADPSVAGLLTKLQESSEGRSQERLGGGPPGRMMPRRSGDYPMGPPSFLENLSEAQRKQFREAERQARDSEVVNEVKAKLELLRKDDETLRRKRMELLREIRVATLNEMVRIDPELAGLREDLVKSWRAQGSARQKSGPESSLKSGRSVKGE